MAECSTFQALIPLVLLIPLPRHICKDMKEKRKKVQEVKIGKNISEYHLMSQTNATNPSEYNIPPRRGSKRKITFVYLSPVSDLSTITLDLRR
jgi:hypothetical protein